MEKSKIIIFGFLLITVLLACNKKNNYDLKIEEIPFREETAWRPVLSNGPSGDRFNWEMHAPEHLAQKIFVVSFDDSTIHMGNRAEKKEKGYGNGGGEIRHYKITLDLTDGNKYRFLRIWANTYSIDEMRHINYKSN